MRAFVSRLSREPLLHFLLLGAALFLYYDFAGENAETPPKRIHVERGQVAQLAANFQRTWSRPPTVEELDTMVESFVREEVFYREALAMGLDRDDPLVRRRLRMKLEFMLEDLASQVVDDARLNEFMQAGPEQFREEAKTSFRQVFLDPGSRPQLEDDAAELLAQLNHGLDPETAGDPTLAQRDFRHASDSEVARLFGEAFASQLASLPSGRWTGPLDSPFGAHLVRIDQRIESRLPELAEIRDRVLREYQVEQKRLQKDLVYQRLREAYQVSVEPSGTAGSADAASSAAQ